MQTTTTPEGLGGAGTALWIWLTGNFATAGCEPMCAELCCLADRLAALRQSIAEHPNDQRLVNSEMKASAAFARCWRLLGLADADAKGKPGFPAGVPRRPRAV